MFVNSFRDATLLETMERARLIAGFKTLVVIPLTILVVMSSYSLLLGWNPITMIVFWFFIVPFLVLFLTSRLLKEDQVTMRSVVSLIAFYSFVVWMIYKHYQSDAFVIMMFSFLYNFLIMCLVMFVRRVDGSSRGR